jgi:hypothetical protein
MKITTTRSSEIQEQVQVYGNRTHVFLMQTEVLIGGNEMQEESLQYEYSVVTLDDNFVGDAVLIATKHLADYNISKMTVVVSTGKEFDATDIARINMMSAVMNQVETTWRLADNSEVIVTVAELSEAVAKALEKFGQIKGIR